jgi:hypothetical protein
MPLPALRDYKIDLNQALIMRYQQGLSYEAIAQKFHVTKQAVFNKFNSFKALTQSPDDIKAYQVNKALIFDAAQMQIVNCLVSLTDEQKTDLMLRQPGAMALWFNSFGNHSRLERGLSTSITEARGDHEVVQNIQINIGKLQSLGLDTSNLIQQISNVCKDY